MTKTYLGHHDVRKVAKRLAKHGMTWESGHGRGKFWLIGPDGRRIGTLPNSPSNGGWMTDLRSRLRRAGYPEAAKDVK